MKGPKILSKNPEILVIPMPKPKLVVAQSAQEAKLASALVPVEMDAVTCIYCAGTDVVKRSYGIKLYTRNQIIQTVHLFHRQVYDFSVHRAKLALLLQEYRNGRKRGKIGQSGLKLLVKLKNRNLNGFGGMMLFNNFLNLINDIWQEILFAAILTHLCGHFFNYNKFAFIPLCSG